MLKRKINQQVAYEAGRKGEVEVKTTVSDNEGETILKRKRTGCFRLILSKRN